MASLLTICGVCVLMILIAGAQAQYYQINNDDWLGFGNIEPFLSTESTAAYMKEDAYLQGNIIFADGASLKTTTDDGMVTDTLAGEADIPGYVNGPGSEARFGIITGFAQLTDGTVVIADSSNNCLRLLDRNTNTVSDYVGVCGDEGGNQNGAGATSEWLEPYDVVIDRVEPTRLLVSDSGNQIVRSVSLSTGNSVGEAVRMTGLTPQHMTWPLDESSKVLYATAVTSTQMLKLHEGGRRRPYAQLDAGSSTESGTADGARANSRFTKISAMEFLHVDVYIVSDELNPGLRLINSYMDEVITACGESADFPLFSCDELGAVRSLLLYNEYLYVGSSRQIFRLRVRTGKSFGDLTTLILPTTVLVDTTTATTTTKMTSAPTTTKVKPPPFECVVGRQCSGYCAEGFVTDSNGCVTCECNGCGQVCEAECQFGYKLDERGCRTCECKTDKSAIRIGLAVGSILAVVLIIALLTLLLRHEAKKNQRKLVISGAKSRQDETDRGVPMTSAEEARLVSA